MAATRDLALLAAIGAGLAALVYIGRCIGRVSAILQLVARLPAAHADLVQATERNTQNIADLTRQVAYLTSDVAKLVRR